MMVLYRYIILLNLQIMISQIGTPQAVVAEHRIIQIFRILLIMIQLYMLDMSLMNPLTQSYYLY